MHTLKKEYTTIIIQFFSIRFRTVHIPNRMTRKKRTANAKQDEEYGTWISIYTERYTRIHVFNATRMVDWWGASESVRLCSACTFVLYWNWGKKTVGFSFYSRCLFRPHFYWEICVLARISISKAFVCVHVYGSYACVRRVYALQAWHKIRLVCVFAKCFTAHTYRTRTKCGKEVQTRTLIRIHAGTQTCMRINKIKRIALPARSCVNGLCCAAVLSRVNGTDETVEMVCICTERNKYEAQ